MTILSFTFFSLFILTVGLDYQVLGLTTTTASGERYVQMRASAPFKIALFADLHFGEATSTDWGPLQDLMESEWPQTQTQNDYLILHLLLSLHPDRRIRLPSARLNNNNGLR
ncbi:putative inactive purple acid phosphatase 16 [Quercus suber]|uniref:Inactive purple acid phosphatase 16 n=1 Tax=Quercus suber TaxID=58331 RepID=A0AAW0KI78_QUESU